MADVRAFKRFLLQCNIARGNGSIQIEISCTESSYLPVYVVPLFPTCLKAKKKKRKKGCSCVTCTYAVAVTYPAELELSPLLLSKRYSHREGRTLGARAAIKGFISCSIWWGRLEEEASSCSSLFLRQKWGENIIIDIHYCSGRSSCNHWSTTTRGTKGH